MEGDAVKITPKNWGEFQHYKDRAPAWIKLHKNLLDNYEFQCLPVASRALAPMLWLLASEYEGGVIEAAPEKIAFRLRVSFQELNDAIKPLIDNGFFILEQSASSVIAERLPREEKRREREEEEPRRGEAEFEAFWQAWPASTRKQAKGKCMQAWVRAKATAGEVLPHIEALKASEEWRRESGRFIPAPLVYLNQRRWEGAESAESGAAIFEGAI